MESTQTARLLPIGSVVKLAYDNPEPNMSYIFMIIGYFAVSDDEPDKVWDYTAVPFPSGLMDANETIQIDNNEIAEVQFIGYEDEESESLLSDLEHRAEEIRTQAKQGTQEEKQDTQEEKQATQEAITESENKSDQAENTEEGEQENV
jgi:hypothetical protein